MIKLAVFASVSIMMTKNGFAAAVVAGYMRTALSMMSPMPWSCMLGVFSKQLNMICSILTVSY